MTDGSGEKVPLSRQQQQFTGDSPFAAYRKLVTGDSSLWFFAYYELVTSVLGPIPGLVGLGLRTLLYPTLFQSGGVRPAIGRSTSWRNPSRISLGKKVLVDDYVVVDSRSDGEITLGDYASVGKYSILAAKGGSISLGAGVNVGTHCRIATQSCIAIGESTLIAAYCYIGPGNHMRNPEDGTFISGEMEQKGGVSIGKNVWIGTRSTILDGVTIGDNAVIGAHSLVRDDVPPNTTVVGTPARPLERGSTSQA